MPPFSATPPPARWFVRQQRPDVAHRLKGALSLHPVAARVLAARGWEDPEPLGRFLDPKLASLRDPADLPGMAAAVDRTLHAIRHKEPIAIYGDYDVDGVCATAIMVLTLRRLGVEPMALIPHRISDGYGLSRGNIELLAAKGTRLLITVDTGVTAVAEVERAHELGMDVVITDHHLSGPVLPRAAALVNPTLAGPEYGGTRLCGAGVAFKFAHSLLKASATDAASSRGFLRSLIDLVALGTVADVMPLMEENRVFVRHGLEMLKESQRPGIRALLEVSGARDRVLTADSIGFLIGPRLNAAGRTAHAQLALDLLLTDQEQVARDLAHQLETLNRHRRQVEAQILEHSVLQAEQQFSAGHSSFLVVAGDDWHLGVVGIVASRLTERFHLPAVVLATGSSEARGSARSIPGFDVHRALDSCSDLLVQFGGHAGAAGLRIHRGRIPEFRDAVNRHAHPILAAGDFSPLLTIDTTLEADEIDSDLCHGLLALAPFGQDNPAPVFLARGVRSTAAPRVVGNNHLKLSLRLGPQSFPAIGFGLAHLADMAQPGGRSFDIAFRPTENHWRGDVTVELELVGARLSA